MQHQPDMAADFLLSKFHLHESSIAEFQNKEQENEEKEKEDSIGTGSFTTGQFNARLAGSEGMAILRYIQDENFGKHGESIKLMANIQEFMTQLASENQRIEEENILLTRQNESFQQLSSANQ